MSSYPNRIVLGSKLGGSSDLWRSNHFYYCGETKVSVIGFGIFGSFAEGAVARPVAGFVARKVVLLLDILRCVLCVDSSIESMGVAFAFGGHE